MASTYSSNISIEIIGSGDQAGTWGDTTNENWKRIEQSASTYSTVSLSGKSSPYNWLLSNSTNAGDPGSEGRSAFVEFTNASGDMTINIRGNTASDYPNRVFFAYNNSGNDLTFNCNSSTDFILKNGFSAVIYTDPGTKVGNALNSLQTEKVAASSLTSGRVVIAGSNGLLGDDSDLTFSGDTLTATKIGAFTAAGSINFDNQDMTNVDIDSGAIDGTDVTVGTGKTLNVSAGTLTTSATQKKSILEGAGSNIDIGSYDLRAGTITPDGLTATRVVFAGTDGVLSDDSDFTYNTSTNTLDVENVTGLKSLTSESSQSLVMTLKADSAGTTVEKYLTKEMEVDGTTRTTLYGGPADPDNKNSTTYYGYGLHSGGGNVQRYLNFSENITVSGYGFRARTKSAGAALETRETYSSFGGNAGVESNQFLEIAEAITDASATSIKIKPIDTSEAYDVATFNRLSPGHAIRVGSEYMLLVACTQPGASNTDSDTWKVIRDIKNQSAASTHSLGANITSVEPWWSSVHAGSMSPLEGSYAFKVERGWGTTGSFTHSLKSTVRDCMGDETDRQDVTPSRISVLLRCHTANANYAVGEVLSVSPEYLQTSANTTSIYWVANSGGVKVLDKSTRALATVTNANFHLVFEAWS